MKQTLKIALNSYFNTTSEILTVHLVLTYTEYEDGIIFTDPETYSILFYSIVLHIQVSLSFLGVCTRVVFALLILCLDSIPHGITLHTQRDQTLGGLVN